GFAGWARPRAAVAGDRQPRRAQPSAALAARRAGAGQRHVDHARRVRWPVVAPGAGPPRGGRGVRPRPVGGGDRGPAVHLRPRVVPQQGRPGRGGARPRGRQRRPARAGADRGRRPQPAPAVRRADLRRGGPRPRPGAGTGGSAGVSAVAELHRHHRRGLRRRPRPRHDGGQQRRPGRPDPARHPHHRHRAPHHRPGVHRGRAGRLQQRGRVRHRQRIARRGRRPGPAAPGRHGRAGARRRRRDVGQRERPLRAGRADRPHHRGLQQRARGLPAGGGRAVRRLLLPRRGRGDGPLRHDERPRRHRGRREPEV
ncbi:MAG: Rod shape-determining protein MreC, partial [uncultured Nocardioides sp.]